MNGSPTVVLDASALLAYLRAEPGADVAGQALVAGAALSAVNWSETLAKLYDLGWMPSPSPTSWRRVESWARHS